jgi:hypothetical protein
MHAMILLYFSILPFLSLPSIPFSLFRVLQSNMVAHLLVPIPRSSLSARWKCHQPFSWQIAHSSSAFSSVPCYNFPQPRDDLAVDSERSTGIIWSIRLSNTPRFPIASTSMNVPTFYKCTTAPPFSNLPRRLKSPLDPLMDPELLNDRCGWEKLD